MADVTTTFDDAAVNFSVYITRPACFFAGCLKQ
jgi:hypothetical protein